METNNPVAELSQLHVIGTIPPYFLQNMFAGVGTVLDAPNWSTNIDLIIKDYNRNNIQQTAPPKGE